MGAKTKLKAGAASDKEGKPPQGAANARRTGNQPGKPPAGRMVRPPAPVPPGFGRGDARGEAPCMK